MPRVMLLEDNVSARRAIVSALRPIAEVVAYATIAQAEPHLHEPWDGMIIDHRLPDGDGLELAKRVRVLHPQVELVLHTAVDPAGVIHEASKHGIVIAPKPSGFPVVRMMVERCTQRPALGMTAAVRLAALARRTKLTAREVEIIRAALEGLGRADGAQRLGIGEGTHKSHVSQVLRKTGYRRMQHLLAALSGDTPAKPPSL